MSVANSSIAQLYIAYFNRAPEPLGFDFWCGVLDNPVTLEEIASAFATQPEAVAMYPLLEARTTDSLGDFLTTVYQNLFDRDPDDAGRDFWTGVIQGGADFGTILLEIINGASDEDRAVLEAKASVAEYWVGEARKAPGYALTDDAIAASRDAIEAAGTDADAGTAVADAYFAPAAQVSLSPVENDVRPGVLLTTPLKVADIAVTGDDPEEDDTVLGLTGTDAGRFEIVGTELFLKAGGIVNFGSDKMMDVVVTLDDTRDGHFRIDGAESGAGLRLTQADIPVAGEGEFAWDPEDEFQVNAFTSLGQIDSAVAALPDGRFVVTFTSADASPSQGDEFGFAVKARIFEDDGDPDSDEFLINSFTTGSQQTSDVVALANGKFVVVWRSDDAEQAEDTDGSAIKARIFDDDGEPDSAEFVVNQNPQNLQSAPSVALLANGQFVVVWESTDRQDDDFDNFAIKGRVFDADGDPAGNEFQVNEIATNNQWLPKVVALPDGRFVVTWQSNDQADVTPAQGFDTKARIFDADGDPAGDEFLVNEITNDFQGLPDIAVLENGNFVITWESADGGSDDMFNRSVWARVYDSSGDPVGDEFLVNEIVRGNQSEPAVIAIADGGFMVSWTSNDADQDEDMSGTAVKGRMFDATGLPTSDEFVVNERPLNDQTESALTSLPNGDIVAAWTTQDALNITDNFGDVAARLFEIEGNDDATVQRVVAELNPEGDFIYDPAEMVGIPMPVEPDGGIA